MVPDLKLSFKLALRARFATMAFYLLLAMVGAALLAAQFSARQLATVSLDVGLSVIRLGLPVIAVLLVQELMTREIDRRLYLTSLTYPRPRRRWLLGRVSAVCLMLLSVMVLMAVALAVVVAFEAGMYTQATPVSLGLPYLVTLVFIALDLLAVVAVATLLAVTATTPSFVLIGSLGFVLIARSYMPIVQMLRDNQSLVSNLADPKTYTNTLNALSYLLPDLGTLDVRMVALYGKLEFLPGQWPFVVGATLAYVLALLALAAWQLNRRELA